MLRGGLDILSQFHVPLSRHYHQMEVTVRAPSGRVIRQYDTVVPCVQLDAPMAMIDRAQGLNPQKGKHHGKGKPQGKEGRNRRGRRVNVRRNGAGNVRARTKRAKQRR